MRSTVGERSAQSLSKADFFRSLDYIPLPILISESEPASVDRNHVFLNRAFHQQLGYTLDTMPGMASWFLMAYPDPLYRTAVMEEWAAIVADCIARGKDTAEMTALITCASGRQRWFIVTAQIHADLTRNWHVVTFRDVHDIKSMMDENGRLSRTDFLTQLLNRREGMALLEQAWRGWRKQSEPFALMLCDIDHFKHFNDQFGHACGDQVLVSVANCLNQEMGLGARVIRWGGEEFLLILPGQCLQDTEKEAERVRAAIAGLELEWGGQVLRPTVSVGYAATDQTLWAGVDELLQQVDAALYQAKRAGRNRTAPAMPA